MAKHSWKQCTKCRKKISVRVDGNSCFVCTKRASNEARKEARAK